MAMAIFAEMTKTLSLYCSKDIIAFVYGVVPVFLAFIFWDCFDQQPKIKVRKVWVQQSLYIKRDFQTT